MTIDIEKLPSYQPARDEYVAQIQAAKAASDETAELRAELAWERTQKKLRDEADKLEEREKSRLDALELAKEKYPKVPAELYETLDDPKAILEHAEKLQAIIDSEVRAAQPAGQRWPQPSGAPAPASAGGKDRYNDEDYLRPLSARVFKHDGNAIEEVNRVIFDRQVLPSFSKFHKEKAES